MVNLSHNLLGSRFDNWLRLLARAGWQVEKGRRIQAAAISALSLLLFPFALLENLACALPIAQTKLKKDPIFILGHWRSGTTFLQNLLTRDEQFGWADPVSTMLFSNCLLLGPLMRSAVGAGLKDARPMDSVKYSLDLPMEETYALANFTPYSIVHVTAFPCVFEKHIPYAFLEDLSEKQRAEVKRAYTYVLKKLTLLKAGKQLVLKSPDNTAHIETLLELCPEAKFVNIYRDPYLTIKSTIHMFVSEMEQLRLSPLPFEDVEGEMEDKIIYIFERMYRRLFELEDNFKEHSYISFAYEDFVKEPAAHLKRIYEELRLEGFEAALPRFEAFLDSQKDYKKNKHEVSDRLRKKINARLGFYFERCGYEMIG
ncbi:MAG: sulfotransferase [Oscillospiraceae bacterium]|nr:sulfotransferase [Oscillospiraceae bacterium]